FGEAELVAVVGEPLVGQVDSRGGPAEVHDGGGWGLGRSVFGFLAVLGGGDAQRGVVVRCFRGVGFFARLGGQRGWAGFDEAAALACGWLGRWRAAVACAVSGILGNVWVSHRIHLRPHWVRFLTRNALPGRVFAACDGFYTMFLAAGLAAAAAAPTVQEELPADACSSDDGEQEDHLIQRDIGAGVYADLHGIADSLVVGAGEPQVEVAAAVRGPEVDRHGEGAARRDHLRVGFQDGGGVPGVLVEG